MELTSILWRRLDVSGHDICLLRKTGDRWHLSGTAIFSEGQAPCRLDYDVCCDEEWRTTRGAVRGWLGDRPVSVDITANPSAGWRLNDTIVPATRGCLDLDLSFTPSTNLIPIRRLDLEIGGSSPSPAAWLAFPVLELAPLEQAYRRKDRWSYQYSAPEGFSVELKINHAGFVTHYPGRWEAVAATP